MCYDDLARIFVSIFLGSLEKYVCAFGPKYKLSQKNNLFYSEEFNLDLTLTSLSIINATLYTRKRHCLMLFVRGHSSAGRAPALQAGGRRFDPVWLHHLFCKSPSYS